MEKLVEVKDLKKYFWMGGGPFRKKEAVKAIDNVSFFIKEKEILGLVGESGCGKTTCGKVILRLMDPTAGNVYFDGYDITCLKQKEMLQLAKLKLIPICQTQF